MHYIFTALYVLSCYFNLEFPSSNSQLLKPCLSFKAQVKFYKQFSMISPVKTYHFLLLGVSFLTFTLSHKIVVDVIFSLFTRFGNSLRIRITPHPCLFSLVTFQLSAWCIMLFNKYSLNWIFNRSSNI